MGSDEEDRIILNNVEKYGDTLQTFKELCKRLCRHHHLTIRKRFEWLQNRPSEPPGAWNVSQDQMLIEHIFQDKLEKLNNIDFLDSSKPKDFVTIAKKIGKSMYACYGRWNFYIVPVLKSDALGVAQNVEWMNDVLRYIVKEKFASTKEVPYSRVVKDCCPGQTTYSVESFLTNVSKYDKDTQLHELCKKRLTSPSPNS